MKLILFKNTIESQEFFSFELARAFRDFGHQVFFYDCARQEESFAELCQFIELGNTAAFAFNFNGMINDDYLLRDKDPVFWNLTGIPYVNMIVDHPFYYHEQFAHIPGNYAQIEIDRKHVSYMRRFFPDIDADHFVELGGTDFWQYTKRAFEPIPVSKRKYDIVFTGHYTDPMSYEKYISHLEKSVQDFYFQLYYALQEENDRTLEDLAEERLRRDFGDAVDDEYLKVFYQNAIFLDLMIRHYYRGKAVAALADAGFQVDIFGTGFENVPCRHPENMVIHGRVNSRKCLEVISNGKISLNVMPWFKEGGHDRVFNSMLNGAICLSDPSLTLKEHFTDGKDILFYDLGHLQELPDICREILSNPDHMEQISANAYENARKNHSWAARAKEILQIIESRM